MSTGQSEPTEPPSNDPALESTGSGPISKLKRVFHTEPTQSAHSEGFPDSEIRDRVDAARETHEKAEAEADTLIHEREEEEAQEAEGFHPPTVTQPRSDLSSFARRPSLNEAAHPHKKETSNKGSQETHPDMTGVTQIRESELHHRSERTEHTALRPSDPNDPNAMDGAARDENSAGDDFML